jgi:peroxiredoxin Q/BCP
LRGSSYIIYFYPKDDTPGCTLEACGFRDSLPRFSAKGVRVLGVSPDSPEAHARFRKKYGLTFPLLSDPEKTLAKAYGVWVLKKLYGREYMGVQRSTFFVDRSGSVKKVWRAVRRQAMGRGCEEGYCGTSSFGCARRVHHRHGRGGPTAEGFGSRPAGHGPAA